LYQSEVDSLTFHAAFEAQEEQEQVTSVAMLFCDVPKSRHKVLAMMEHFRQKSGLTLEARQSSNFIGLSEGLTERRKTRLYCYSTGALTLRDAATCSQRPDENSLQRTRLACSAPGTYIQALTPNHHSFDKYHDISHQPHAGAC
jgi:hypothetical protein